MSDYISREAAISYIREKSEEMIKAFEELGGESGIYADAYNDLAEDFHRIHAADVARHNDVRAARIHLKHSIAGVGVFVDNVLHCALQLHELFFFGFHQYPPFLQNRHTFTDNVIIPHTCAFGKSGRYKK